MIKVPFTNKRLTGDAERCWNHLVEAYGHCLKERNKPLLFALCQQWEVYQKGHSAWKREKDTKMKHFLWCQMSGSLKHYNTMSKRFAMGINDKLEFSVPDDLPGGLPENPSSRISELLKRIQT